MSGQLAEILRVAAWGYGQETILELPPDKEAALRHDRGDLLADWIVVEISEVAEGSTEPVHEVIEAMRKAQADIGRVIGALESSCDGDGNVKAVAETRTASGNVLGDNDDAGTEGTRTSG